MGATVRELMFAGTSGYLLDAKLGGSWAELTARAGEPTDGVYLFEVDDPVGSGRRLEVRVRQQHGRVHMIDGRFFSANKIDVDAAYDAVRKHLKAAHGRPGRERGGVLKFVYTLEGVEHASRTTVCRFKDADGTPVMEVTTRLEQGVTLPGVGKGQGLSAKKGN